MPEKRKGRIATTVQFIPGKTPKVMGMCKIVEGEINPHGHCIAFTSKPKK
jgi:hypothetical protein